MNDEIFEEERMSAFETACDLAFASVIIIGAFVTIWALFALAG
jgi:hypothetical protein